MIEKKLENQQYYIQLIEFLEKHQDELYADESMRNLLQETKERLNKEVKNERI